MSLIRFCQRLLILLGCMGFTIILTAENVWATPLISQQTPINNSVIGELKPRISASISSSSQLVPETVVLKLDGEVVASSYESVDSTHAVVYFFPTSNLRNEAYHDVNLVANDSTGEATVSDWRFYSNTYPEMNKPNVSCETCHFSGNIAQHPTTQCNLCHQPQSHGGRLNPLGDCLWCHNFLYSRGFTGMTPYPAGYTHDGSKLLYENRERYFEFTACDECHASTTYTDIPRHGSAFDEALEHQTPLSENCVKCHSVTLTREHAQPDRTDENGLPVTCSTCHASTNTQVQQSIATGNKQCTSCHASSTTHVSEHVVNLGGCQSANCHTADLSTDHQKYNFSCGDCHNSTLPQVKQAVDHSNKDCGVCHNSAHGLGVQPCLPQDIPIYPELKWTTPVPLSIWKGEHWVNFDPTNYMLILSNRSLLSGDDVWSYYRESMATQGWTMDSLAPDPGSNSFTVTFTKDGRSAIIWFYGSEDHSGSGTVATGSRIEILFTP